jgi:hypothetical protein
MTGADAVVTMAQRWFSAPLRNSHLARIPTQNPGLSTTGLLARQSAEVAAGDRPSDWATGKSRANCCH